MRLIRQFVISTFLAVAFVAAMCKLADAQAVNPTFIEFTSADHAIVTHYRVCFYPSATATAAARCNDVPVSSAVSQGGMVYRMSRAVWATGLIPGTNYWPRVRAVSSSLGQSTGEAAPLVTPFFFTLSPAPRDVSDVILVP